MVTWEGENSQSFRDIGGHPFGQTRSILLVLLRSLGKVDLRRGAVRGIEYRADIFSDFSLHVFVWYVGLSVLLQVELATLPGNATKYRQPCSSQTGVVFAGNQLHSAQTAPFQAFQEGAPVGFVLTQRH